MSELRVALAGMPNCGKTALFNRLTGSRQKVANYAGVTVERKEGQLTTSQGRRIRLLDLPGAYSLVPASLDEAVTRDVLRGFYPGEPRPYLILCVVDSTNLQMHLRLVAEVLAQGLPTVLVLNMHDAASKAGIQIDTNGLSAALGIPVVTSVAVRNDGVQQVLAQLDAPVPSAMPTRGDTPMEGADIESATVLASNWFGRFVRMPSQRERLDDRLDAWLLHPIVGLLQRPAQPPSGPQRARSTRQDHSATPIHIPL